NVNTAGAAGLCSRGDNPSIGAAEARAQARGREGVREVASFMAQPAFTGGRLPNPRLALASEDFQATTAVRLGDRRLALVSLLQREGEGEVRVLQRNLGQPPRLPRQTDDGDR